MSPGGCIHFATPRAEMKRSAKSRLFRSSPKGGNDFSAVSPIAHPKMAIAPPCIAVVDGPYDAKALSAILARAPIDIGENHCGKVASGGCAHGTFIMALLGARRDAPIPGLCPECQLLHVPLFVDRHAPSATVAELANAIKLATDGGARIVNLSLAILGDETSPSLELARALNAAAASGVIIVAAAGNQRRPANGQLLNHAATVPVAAIDAAFEMLPDCNFGPALAERGIAAFGHRLPGYAPGGRTTIMSGTSVATAVASATLAKLWALRPHAEGADVLAAIRKLAPRDGSIPPMLRQREFLAALDRRATGTAAQLATTSRVVLQGESAMSFEDRGHPSPDRSAGISGQVVIPAQDVPGCGCGSTGGICTCSAAKGPMEFIYVLGSVDIRFPDQSISEELQTIARDHNIRPQPIQRGDGNNDSEKGVQERKDEELRAWYFRVLKLPAARYVARQVCWILKVEGQLAYHIELRDLHDLDDLISCLEHSADADLDLFVGSSPLSEVEKCPGLTGRVLTVEFLSSFKKVDLIQWFGTVPKKQRSPGSRRRTTEDGESAPNELYEMLVQGADNFGHTDDQRALNYLAVRYKPLYELYSRKVLKDDWNFTGVEVFTSRLSGNRHIVDPVFTFERSELKAVERYFVRVDVSHMFPMIVNHVARYVARKS